MHISPYGALGLRYLNFDTKATYKEIFRQKLFITFLWEACISGYVFWVSTCIVSPFSTGNLKARSVISGFNSWTRNEKVAFTAYKYSDHNSRTQSLAIFFCSKSAPNSYWDSTAYQSHEWAHNKNHIFPCFKSAISFPNHRSQTDHYKGQIVNKFQLHMHMENGDNAKSIAIYLLIWVLATGCSMECNIHKINTFNATQFNKMIDIPKIKCPQRNGKHNICPKKRKYS